MLLNNDELTTDHSVMLKLQREYEESSRGRQQLGTNSSVSKHKDSRSTEKRTALSWSRYQVQEGRSAFSKHLVKSRNTSFSSHSEHTQTKHTFSLNFTVGALRVLLRGRSLSLLLNGSSVVAAAKEHVGKTVAYC